MGIFCTSEIGGNPYHFASLVRTILFRVIVAHAYEGLFEAGDWDYMARAILEYAQSKEKTKELGEQAKNIIHENQYLWLENARRTLALLKS